MKRFVASALLVLLAACKGGESHETKSAPSASATTSALASESASAGPARPPNSYAGSYDSKPGVLFVPDGGPWEDFKFRGDKDAGALGEGKLSFVVDATTHTLSGELEGPLGPATLSGTVRDGAITFTLTPREQGDMAFHGTATGTLDAGVATGEIQASSWHANVLRTATFTAKSGQAP